MADSETQQAVDSTQQVTSETPATREKKSKTCCRRQSYRRKDEAGPRGAEKKLAEADIIIANEQLKKTEAAAASDPPAAEPPAADPPAADPPTRNVLTTTQWLSVISIFISIVGIYYKREEIKKVLIKNPHRNPLHQLWMSRLRLKEKEASARWIKN